MSSSELLDGLTDSLAAAVTTDEVLDAIFEGVPPALGIQAAAVFRLSDDGREVLAERLRDYPPELAGRFPIDAPHPLNQALARREVLVQPGPQPGTAMVLAPFLAHGRPIGGLGLVWDASREFGEAERRLLQKLARRCATALERARLYESRRNAQRLETVGTLAAGVAHDFNNMLTSVLGCASLIEDAAEPGSETAQWASQIVQSARRAADLTRQLLAYSGQGRYVVRPLDLAAAARDLMPLLRSSVPHNIDLDFHLPEGLPQIDADRSQLDQALLSLAMNASEAIGDAPGAVRVAAFYADPYVCLEVRDTGCGMDAATMARAFDPFFSTKFIGRGMGLAAVHGIAHGHGGFVTVESRPGQGSTFRLLLPARPAPPKAEPQPAAPPASVARCTTILVVDDEEVVRTVAAAALGRYGHTVLLAAGGREAIDLAEAHPEIELVVLDMTMPEMTGEQTLHGLRALRPGLPVLLSSGYDIAEADRRFKSEHLAGFLPKPYTAETLLQAVAAALR